MAIEIAGGTRIDESADDGSSTIRPNAAGAVDAVDARGSLSWVRQGESDQGGECGGLDHRAKSILGPLNAGKVSLVGPRGGRGGGAGSGDRMS